MIFLTLLWDYPLPLPVLYQKAPIHLTSSRVAPVESINDASSLHTRHPVSGALVLLQRYILCTTRLLLLLLLPTGAAAASPTWHSLTHAASPTHGRPGVKAPTGNQRLSDSLGGAKH